MEFVDAFWEKRNLGVTCTEVSLSERDTIQEVVSALSKLDTQYQVVKVPAARYDLMAAVEKAGFSFIEGSMNVLHYLKPIEHTGIMKRLNDSVTYEEMTENDVERLYEEVKKGIFITDRIYLDQAFTPEQAAQRYVFWLTDAVKAGAQLYKLIYKQQAVGFFIFKETIPGQCYPFLSGLYSGASTPGMGTILLHKIIREAARRGLKLIDSYISTNNLPVLKTHIAEGFTIGSIHYVYIKHTHQ